MAGQVPAQFVKTKSATQVRPRRSCRATARPDRSVKANPGTSPRTGSGAAASPAPASGGGSPPPARVARPAAAAPSTATTAPARIAARGETALPEAGPEEVPVIGGPGPGP
jgi:translation initiation factor IF-2